MRTLMMMREAAAVVLASLVAGGSALASTGSIEIDIEGVSGEIVLDGFPTGLVAPATIDSVAPGEHLVEIVHGCMEGSAQVMVYRDQTATGELSMRHVGGVGTLRLRGMPPGAMLFVDEAPVRGGEQGVEVPCGAHRLRVEASGFADWEEEVVVTAGRWSTVNLEMQAGEIEPAYTPPPRQEVEEPRRDELDDGLDELEDPLDRELAGGDDLDDLDDGLDDLDDLDDLDGGGRGGLDDGLDELDDPLDEEPRGRDALMRAERGARERGAERRERERSRYDELDDLDGGGGDLDDDLREIESERYDEEDDLDWDGGGRSSRYEEDEFDELDDLGSSRGRDSDEGGGSIVLPSVVTGVGVVTLGYGIVAYSDYQETYDIWVQLAASNGFQSEEALAFWNQNVAPKKTTYLAATIAGGVLTAAGGGLFWFNFMEDEVGFGVRGEW